MEGKPGYLVLMDRILQTLVEFASFMLKPVKQQHAETCIKHDVKLQLLDSCQLLYSTGTFVWEWFNDTSMSFD